MCDTAMITAIQWIPKGYAKRNPKEYDLNDEEIEQMKQDPLVQEHLQGELDESSDDMQCYATETKMLKGQKIDEEYPEGFEERSEDDKEDYTIKKTDSIIVGAKLQGEYSTLEVYVYEDETCNLFVHHEIVLSAFPLCMEFLPVDPSSYQAESMSKGNYLILGTFLPEIEIWNLDVLNTMEPAFQLGEEIQQNKKKSKKFNQQKSQHTGHQDAVMCLSLNQFRKNILCSGSADTTIKIWDVCQQKNLHTYNIHKDKVQSVKWNPTEESILFSAGFDKQIKMFDARTSSQNSSQSNQLKSDIECAIWDPINPVRIVFSCEDGSIGMLDARKFDQEFIFNVQAHEKSCTSISMSPEIEGMLISTSLDGYVKVWDIKDEIKPVFQKNMKAQKLFCSSFQQDNPWLLACGSSLGEMVIWDMAVAGEVANHFGPRASQKPHFGTEQMMQKQENQEDQEDFEQQDEDGIEIEQ